MRHTLVNIKKRERKGDQLRRRIYVFIVRSLAQTGVPPTEREIQEALHLKGPGHIAYYLAQLEELGILRFTGQRGTTSRIRLCVPLAVPVLGMLGSRGLLDSFTGAENAPETLTALEQEPAYALRVGDSSLLHAHLCEGDYLIVEPLPPMDTGQVLGAALHRLNGREECRAVIGLLSMKVGRPHVLLRPFALTHAEETITRAAWNRDWHVLGRVTTVVRLFSPPEPERNEIEG